MGKSINSKELSSKNEGLISGDTELYAVNFNYSTTLGKATRCLKLYTEVGTCIVCRQTYK
jgi:hypothetical protein